MSRDSSTAAGWDGILNDGETILWQGRPHGQFHISAGKMFEALFGMAFAGFALFWMAMASKAGGSFWMFGLLHFAVGLGLVGHALYWPTFRRKHTWYTLTSERAFIATDLPILGKKLKSYPITPDTALQLEDTEPGTIWFAHEYRRTKNGSRRVNIGFERIDDARGVLRRMNDIQRGRNAGT